jgi:hypothetical protein
MPEIGTIATVFIKVLKLVSSREISSHSAGSLRILGLINVSEIASLADLFLRSSVTGISSVALQQHVSLQLATFIMWCACTVVVNSHYVSYVAERLHDLYSSADINGMVRTMMMRWAGNVARKRVMRNAYRVSVGKDQGQRSTGRPTRRWKDHIDLQKTGYYGMDWIHVAQNREVGGSCKHSNEYLCATKFRALEWLRNYQLIKKDSAPQSVSQSLSYFVHLHIQNEKHDFMICEPQFGTKTPVKPYRLVCHGPVYRSAQTLCSESQYNDS